MTKARSLDPTTHCDECEALFHQQGFIGACDHDFPGRPLRRFWCVLERLENAPGLASPSWRIGLCRAATWAEAREVLQPPEGRQISAFVTWWLFEKLDETERGVRLELELDRLPSAYDQWAYGPGGGHDYRQMEEDGKDVS